MKNNSIRYPKITARISGENGNAFNILAIMRSVMRKEGVSEEEIEEFTTEATSGDYYHLLATCAKWVRVK